MIELNSLKQQVYQHCLEQVTQKADRLQQDMAAIQASANEETKSTAGDKYETARAMAMIEKENLSKQLGEAMKQVQVLQQVNPEQSHQKAALGALVYTTDGKYYYLSISLGPTKVNGHTILVISPVSPIGQLLLGKAAGNQFQFNRQTMTIKAIA